MICVARFEILMSVLDLPHTHTQIYPQIDTHTHTQIYTQIYTHTNTHTHTHTQIYTQIYTHTQIYTLTETQRNPPTSGLVDGRYLNWRKEYNMKELGQKYFTKPAEFTYYTTNPNV
jgi:hypothetical protein